MTRRLPLLALVTLVLAGCAHYRTGSLMHPQVHSIAVARVRNDTDRARLGVEAQAKLRRAFMADGSLTLVEDENRADCTLQARIVAYRYQSLGSATRAAGDDREINATRIFGAEVDLEYTVFLPDGKRLLMPVGKVTGSSQFTELPDLEMARADALDLATADAARRAVSAITEAW